MANLLESLQGYMTPDLITRTSNQLGESEPNTTKAFGGIIPAVLAGLVSKTAEPGAMSSVFNLIRQHDGSSLSNLNNTVPGAPGSTLPAGNQFLSEIFGSKLDNISNWLSNFAGIKASSVTAMLGYVAPLVLGFLGKKTKDENLDAGGLSNYLTSQKTSIMNALPAGLGSVLGLSGFAATEPGGSRPVHNAPIAGHHTPLPPKKRNWLWPLLLALAAILLLVFGLRNCNKNKEVEVVTTETEVISPDTTVGTTTTKAFNKKELPGGVVLHIPEGGIESKMVAFIEDKNKAVDKTTWFTFDRLNFETGSARISQDSQEQINNIAEILKAYPQVEIKIGGYTDNVGKPADNLKLSQSRATAVKEALQKLGIEAKRMDAEGYGEQHPVADNTTEEGRAQNRRIDVRVTKK